MNDEEAKLILQCRRSSGRDDEDPAMREALAQLSGDAAAFESLRRESALDAMIGERLRGVEPPADLRQKILVGARLSRRRHWWQRPVWLMAAAAVAVLVPLSLKFLPGRVPGGPVFASIITLTDFRTTTTQKLNDGPKLRRLGDIDTLREHLATHTKMKSVPVPDNLCHSPGGAVGCEVFEWKGHEVTLICFDAGKPGTVHLFTVDASALEQRSGGPIYDVANGWRTCSWIADGRLMLLAGSEKSTTMEDLQELVRNGN